MSTNRHFVRQRDRLCSTSCLAPADKARSGKVGLGPHRTVPSWPRFGPNTGNGEMSDETRRVEEVVIPLAEESASISKREVETGQVRVALSTDIETVIARETLRGCKIEIERVPLNQALPDGEPVPQSRKADRRATHSSSPLLRKRLWW